MTASTPPRKREVRGKNAATMLVRPTYLPHGRWLGDLENEEHLSDAERELLAACAKGVAWEPADWDGTRPYTQIPANRIRAALIRFLLLGGDSLNPVHEMGVMLGGAWIVGELDLYQARCAGRLYLSRCHFEQAPDFSAATLPELGMLGSAVPSINADRMIVKGAVFLGSGFLAAGEVRLLGADIGGNLSCTDGTFANRNGNAISADGIGVKGDVFLSGGFSATGEVRLLGAKIGGDLDCTGGTFTNGNGNALNADSMFVKGSVFLGGGFSSTGEVRLLGASIRADLSCIGGAFINGNGIALNGDRMIVKGGVFLRGGFSATGQVRLLGANIGGNLDCNGGAFASGNGNALGADRLIVNGGIFLSDGFAVAGEVRLLGASIGGDLTCTGGTFANAHGDALSADGIVVDGTLFLQGAGIAGAIRLVSAKVGTMADDTACWASGDHVLDGFHYDRIVEPTDAVSRIGWLQKQRPEHLLEEFKPQPWQQLIKVLRDMGHLHEASVVAIAMQNALRKAKKIKGIRNPLHWVYGKLAGYGYRPMNTVVAMAFVWLVMGFAFWAGADRYAAIGPANPVITSEALYPDAGQLCGHGNEARKTRWTECPGVPDEYSTFQPFIYSLDLILPLVDLQQESDWAPIAEGPAGRDLLAGAILRWLMWFEILFGWTASLILVAVLGRLVEKD